MAGAIRKLAGRLARELTVYRRLFKDPRTPLPARWLLGTAIGYALTPVDLVPDWIPVLGHIDDLVIVPALIWLALRMVPRAVVAEHRRAVDDARQRRSND